MKKIISLILLSSWLLVGILAVGLTAQAMIPGLPDEEEPEGGTSQSQKLLNEVGGKLDYTAGPSGAGYGIPEGGIAGRSPALIYVVGGMISYLLSFLGVAFLFLTIYAGWLWMTASGNEEQIKKAKDLLKNGVIGMAIIFLAGLVSWAVFNLVIELASI